MTTPTQVPAELVAGDTWEWERALSDYSASLYSAIWYFENGNASFSVTASASGQTFAATVAKATTAAYQAGEYRWRLVVTKTSDSTRKTAESGMVTVLTDPAAAGNHDFRSDAKKTLDAIRAVIAGRATSDQMSFSIDGTAVSRMPLRDLFEAEDRYERKVAQEQASDRIAAGGPSGRRILTRLS